MLMVVAVILEYYRKKKETKDIMAGKIKPRRSLIVPAFFGSIALVVVAYYLMMWLK